MECEVCGRTAEADRETGYNADTICPSCARDGWTEIQFNGERKIVREVVSVTIPVPPKDDDAETECPF